MLNKDPDNSKRKMVFYPTILVVQPGDTVRWLPVDKGHNSEAIKGMVPDGAKLWKGKLNKEVDVTFEKPGFYGYKCTPHVSLGMVGLVIVEGDGMFDNLEAAQAVKQRGKAKKSWAAIWEQAGADGLLG
ncbi:MAG: pseudoazurin [Pseudomonadota bacterium]